MSPWGIAAEAGGVSLTVNNEINDVTEMERWRIGPLLNGISCQIWNGIREHEMTRLDNP